ncbi:PREDICTED: ubiquitin-like-specific protease 1A isoform X2 [Lupinus angustifolius]|uniref:ubiquitin-like-specific protease 1A isoform X2 n=1 Tax=Lupinus angustifolius TaxID=3871 RepID=UPI00092F2865|nr:PREDICTED: ubiquitin-like-specific protease 1A isoform X2 [Lupinus angustifolius]
MAPKKNNPSKSVKAVRASKIKAPVSPSPSITRQAKRDVARASKLKAPVSLDPSNTQQVKSTVVRRSRSKARVSPDSSITKQVKKASVSSSKIKAPILLSDLSKTQQAKLAVNKSSLLMLNKLYFFCTRRPKKCEELSVLVSMFGIYLSRKDGYTLRPKGWVSNMVILAAGTIMMEEEKATNGVVTRHIFSPHFMNKVINDSNLSNEDSYKPWCIEDVALFVLQSRLGYDVSQCKLVFAPTLFDEHWSCYAFEPKSRTLYVLDSMGGKLPTHKKNLDDATKQRFEELLVLMNPSLTKKKSSITLVHVDVPLQPTNHDCGIYVLKYMETWDGSIKWQDKTMPKYSHEEILEFRRSFICRWVQHPKNEARDDILKKAGVWGKLT